jgi:hypothetical protein
MRAAGAAILGAAAVGALVLTASRSQAAEPGSGVDFDIDAELSLATNYFGMALAHPEQWSNGQLLSLANFLTELGMVDEATIITDMRLGFYDEINPEPEPLPNMQYIPPDIIDDIADRLEAETG